MKLNSIFVSQNELNKDNNISGKVTYTNILELIPEDKLEVPIKNWQFQYKTEWRWRFLKINEDSKIRHVVEISCTKYNSPKRVYINKFGEWVERDVDAGYDKFVDKEYFSYTNS